jgi:hypothetical protein
VPEGEEGVDDDLEITPPKSKGKSLLGAISGKLTGKRKQADRSPEEASSSKQPGSGTQTVCVVVPMAPRPLSHYHQLNTRSTHSIVMGPPLSASPSFSSFETRASESERNFEAERLRMMFNASQDDLHRHQQHSEEEYNSMRQRYRERESRREEAFAMEREHYLARIAELEKALRDQERRAGGDRRG